MIKLLIVFLLGGMMGVFITALCVVAGDADRCDRCMSSWGRNGQLD